jgi:hypothetical protein
MLIPLTASQLRARELAVLEASVMLDRELLAAIEKHSLTELEIIEMLSEKLSRWCQRAVIHYRWIDETHLNFNVDCRAASVYKEV